MDDLTIDKLWDKLLIQPKISLKCANKDILNKLKARVINHKYRIKEANPDLGLDAFILSFESKELENDEWILSISLTENSPKPFHGIELIGFGEDELDGESDDDYWL